MDGMAGRQCRTHVDAHVVRSEAVVLRDARAAEPSATSWIPV